MTPYFGPGFENDDDLRSDFIRQITLRQVALSAASTMNPEVGAAADIPRTLVRYWHDSSNVPADVQRTLASWESLMAEGFVPRFFDDVTAAEFIDERYSAREVAAFARCRHPAMRSDYLRMCFVLAEGGFYVDADDVLLNDGWKSVFRNGALKLQPLCYDIPTSSMVSATDPARLRNASPGRIHYVNNNPIAAPACHPVLARALERSTTILLSGAHHLDIQSTTGPGVLTAALAAWVRECEIAGTDADVEFLVDWERTAEPCWDLEYRQDARNWRNVRSGVDKADLE